MSRLRNTRTGAWLAEELSVARSFWSKGKGLLGRSYLPAGHGLLLPHCNSIHSLFMRFPFDAVFIDRQGRAVHLIHQMPAFRLSPIVWRADAVIELPAGTIAATGTQQDDVLEVVDLMRDA
jgi:uncharacterized membrane protein (UPF0127 family)